MPSYTSRSQYEQLNNGCKRRGFWSYLYKPIVESSAIGGIRSKSLSIPLLTGSQIHLGYETVLKGSSVERAVTLACNGYKEQLEGHNLLINPESENETYPSEVFEFEVKQQMALVEASIRAFDKWVLPNWSRVYDVLMVEEEGEIIHIGTMENGEEIWFQWKPDALLRDKSNRDLVVGSWKSLGQWGRMQKLGYRRDNQGASESWALEQTFKRWSRDNSGPEWYKRDYPDGPPLVKLIQMGIFIKGRRQALDDSGDGKRITYNPLIWGYRAEGIVPQYAWSWDVPKTKKDGSQYIGNIGNTFKRFAVWEEYDGGIAKWIEDLDKGNVQPEAGDVANKVFQFAEPIYRNEVEVESFARQLSWQETANFQNAVTLNEILSSDKSASEKLMYLDFYFPQNRKECCSYASICPFDGVCFGGNVNVMVDPFMIADRWEPRKNHHELVQIGDD